VPEPSGPKLPSKQDDGPSEKYYRATEKNRDDKKGDSEPRFEDDELSKNERNDPRQQEPS
jgi:hypothetical protein